jgi:hypothetical protein
MTACHRDNPSRVIDGNAALLRSSSIAMSMGEIFVAAVLGLFGLIIALLTFAQFRSVTPNLYRCARCSAEFRKPAHHDFPARCPSCKATDWSTR